LNDDQKAALKICWSRVKVNKAALTEQHSQLSARLQELQQQQQQQQQQFEELASKLPLLQVPQYAQQMRLANAQQQQQQQQQQQELLLQQQRLLSPSPASTQHSAPILQQQQLASPVLQQQMASPALQQQMASPVLQQQLVSPALQQQMALPVLQQQLASPVLQQHSQPLQQQLVQGLQSPHSQALPSGQLCQQPKAFGSMQMLKMEEEIQEVERLLFSDLPSTDACATTPSSAASLPGLWPECMQQQQGTASSEEPLSGLLQEQQVTTQQVGVLSQVQPQVCVLPAVRQQQQQAQQAYLQQSPVLASACQLSVLPQQPQLGQLHLQEQQQQQMCMLPPMQAPLQAPQQLQLLAQQQQQQQQQTYPLQQQQQQTYPLQQQQQQQQQQQTYPLQQQQQQQQQQQTYPLQQQQAMGVHSHQSSMQQFNVSEGGSMFAGTRTASSTQRQQLSSTAEAAADPAGRASPVALGDCSFSGAPVDVAAVAAAAAAAGVRGSFTTSAVHTASGVEEVLLPVGRVFATAGGCAAGCWCGSYAGL
jgi:hypothetical protein